MIRIGFDPMLEAEQRNRALIKEVELYRLAQDGLAHNQPRIRGTVRLLAMLGKEMSSLGASLEARYADRTAGQVSGNNQGNPGDCA